MLRALSSERLNQFIFPLAPLLVPVTPQVIIYKNGKGKQLKPVHALHTHL